MARAVACKHAVAERQQRNRCVEREGPARDPAARASVCEHLERASSPASLPCRSLFYASVPVEGNREGRTGKSEERRKSKRREQRKREEKERKEKKRKDGREKGNEPASLGRSRSAGQSGSRHWRHLAPCSGLSDGYAPPSILYRARPFSSSSSL